jgi:hypothetical protein
VKTIDREELKEKIERGDDFVLLEVLSEQSYARAPARRDTVPRQVRGPRPSPRQGHHRGRLLFELQLTLLDTGRP